MIVVPAGRGTRTLGLPYPYFNHLGRLHDKFQGTKHYAVTVLFLLPAQVRVELSGKGLVVDHMVRLQEVEST